ncbi:transposase [Streptomyces cyaneofuscatus]|uniref:transposase n=1 Tax=Streptomyces cyaneofuscatus TaxID=66883 RepID=UPI0037F5CC36
MPAGSPHPVPRRLPSSGAPGISFTIGHCGGRPGRDGPRLGLPRRRPPRGHPRHLRQPQHGAGAGRRDACPQPQAPRVVGIDEYAMRGDRATGLCWSRRETRTAVDLLPHREAATVAAWLAERPGIEVACRDHAPFFADGASTGAPTASELVSGPVPYVRGRAAPREPGVRPFRHATAQLRIRLRSTYCRMPPLR